MIKDSSGFPPCGAVLMLLFAFSTASFSSHAQADGEAQAASGPPLKIAIFQSSKKRRCYTSGHIAATRTLAKLTRDRINRFGGIKGRPLELLFYDDENDRKKAVENVREALVDPDLLAMIGVSSSSRGRAVFKSLSNEIRSSNIPFITNFAVSSIFKNHPNVFSTRSSYESERVPVLAQFISHFDFKTVAFIGSKSDASVEAVGDGLHRTLEPIRMIADHRIARGDNAELDEQELEAAIADIKNKSPKLLVVAVGSIRTAKILQRLKAVGTTPPVFMLGDISFLPKVVRNGYPNAIYQMTPDAVPEVDRDAVTNVVSEGIPEEWLFVGHKNPDAPKWATGKCPPPKTHEVFSPKNLQAIRDGSQFADMVSLAVTSAQKVGPDDGKTEMRQSIIDNLGRAFADGQGAFKGRFENWSFSQESRVRSRMPFVVILPQGLGRMQLAPVQFLRSRGGKLSRIDTLYMDIDLIRTHTVDTVQKTFYAEFYVAMRVTKDLSIEDVAFTNAFLDPRTNRPQISIEVLHPGGASKTYPRDMRIFRVSGRFRFKPDFESYPFDRQIFSIDLQPTSGDKSFIVQPPPLVLRDQTADTDGWQVAEQYVSYLDDFVPVVDAFTHRPSIVPFYRTRFVWLMDRETTDFYFRVAIPLIFILTVAYLSIFIPKGRLESIVTIQVTALLSSVALYLSLTQVGANTATITDKIFVLAYMVVSLMIIISILRINVSVGKVVWLGGFLSFVHIFVIPAIVLVFLLVVSNTMSLKELTEIYSAPFAQFL